MSGAGKGDKWRDTDFRKYYENIQDISTLSNPNSSVEVRYKRGGKVVYVYNKKSQPY